MKHYLDNQKNLEDLLSTAFYGSSWFAAGTPLEYREKYPLGEYREERWAKILLDGGHIAVWDDEEKKDLKLTLDMLKKAWADENDKCVAHAKGSILCENADFYDADAIVQKAIFGEVVYG